MTAIAKPGCSGLLTLALLILFAGPALAGNPAPSDELLADYSALVQQHERHVFLPIGELSAWESARYNPAVLSQEQLQTLEPAHGGDARYWELRFWCLQMETSLGRGAYGLDGGWASQEDDTLATQLLLKARDCGGASPFALYVLAQIQRDQRELEIGLISADPALSDAARREALIYAIAADEEEFARALERIYTAWPDEAWPKWWHADELFNLGEMERACDWLEEGNAAAKCSYPACWPESLVRAELAQGRQPFAPELCGAILLAGRSRNLSTALRWKEHMKDAELAFKLGGDLRAFNALQGFACRTAAGPGADSNDCLLALVFASAFSGVLLRNYAEDLSQDQVSALLNLQREADSLRNRLRRLGEGGELFNDQLAGAFYTDLEAQEKPHSELEECRERLRRTYRLLPQRRFRAYCEYGSQELQEVQQKLAPRLALIGSFDYQDPRSLEAWTAY